MSVSGHRDRRVDIQLYQYVVSLSTDLTETIDSDE